MKVYNSLSRALEELKPLEPPNVSLYTCGPTVYDHVHIGNLRTYIFEDILRRTLKSSGYVVKHVMNITDIDDKTISRSKQLYPDSAPNEALKKLTSHFETIFIEDAKKIGIDFSNSRIVKATDHIQDMQELICKIPNKYVTDDGIYFDLERYPQYGELVNLDRSHTHHRIQNDEYDKDHVADFALWKAKKEGEPSWDFEIDGKNIAGRPGWHIECSAMSTKYLGQPFDIHTGGIDLMFPHHENEIAQSVSANHEKLAKVFMHSEHLLVDGKKMSKSLNNFYTLDDVIKWGIDPMAFRLLVLQAHYRSQLNFTWESLKASQLFLRRLQAWADLIYQPNANRHTDVGKTYDTAIGNMITAILNDCNTSDALGRLSGLVSASEDYGVNVDTLQKALDKIDNLLGLRLGSRSDISDEQKRLISQREVARKNTNWGEADKYRDSLSGYDIEINDTPRGPIWSRK